MSWVVASKIELRAADMIVDFVGRDYLKIEIRDPSGTIGERGSCRESSSCRGVFLDLVMLLAARLRSNCGSEIAGLGLAGLFFGGVLCGWGLDSHGVAGGRGGSAFFSTSNTAISTF